MRVFLLALLLLMMIGVQAQNPALLYQQGLELKKNGFYGKALDVFRQAHQGDPGNTDILFQAGWCANELKQFDQALGFLQKADTLSGGEGRLHYEIAYALQQLQKPEEALSRYSKALSLMPGDPETLMAIADLYVAKDDCEQALSYYRRYLETASPKNHYFYRAGWCANETGAYTEAVELLTRYVPADDAGRLKKHRELGYAHLKLQQADPAEEHYRRALSLHPGDGASLRGMGELYQALRRDPAAALEHYRKAIEVDEEHSRSAYFKVGYLLNDRGDFAAALPFLQKAVALEEESHRNLEELAFALLKLGRSEEALAYYRKGLLSEPDCVLGNYHLAECYLALKKKKEARAVIDRLHRLDAAKAKELEGRMK